MLPPLGFGAAGIGNLYQAVADEAVAAALQAAALAAPCWIDTAPLYGHGLSEQRIGAFLAGRAGPRPMLSTKIGRRLDPAPRGPAFHGFVAPAPYEPVFDYSYDGALKTFEGSLGRLRVDRLDLLLLHDIGERTHGSAHPQVMAQAEQGAWAAMRRLREEGAVSTLGIGVNEVEVALESLERLQPDVVLVAGRHTLLDRSAERSGLIEACARAGALFVAAAPFNSGLLAGGAHFNYEPASAHLVERARRMDEACRRRGVSLRTAALQFPRRRPGVACVLAGARGADEVREQQRAMTEVLPEDLWAELDAA